MKIQSMQYQLLNRYFPSGDRLNIWYDTDLYKCILCMRDETVEHYFFDCSFIKSFWNSFMRWWRDICECNIQLGISDILFAIVNSNRDEMIDR